MAPSLVDAAEALGQSMSVPSPGDPNDLRQLVALMRELGVVTACGVTLGPPPTRPEVIAAKVMAASASEQPAMAIELERELARARIEAWDDETRMSLAHTGKTYTLEQLRAMRPLPEGLGA